MLCDTVKIDSTTIILLSSEETIMGNIKGRARRNKKRNNWKATQKLKKGTTQDLCCSELGERDVSLWSLTENFE